MIKLNFKKEDDKIKIYGEFTEQGLNEYATYKEIKKEIIAEIMKRLEDDIQLTVESMKPDLLKMIKENNKHE